MNPSTAQATAVVDELARGGVRDVVLCPGSRNAPLAFALQAADSAMYRAKQQRNHYSRYRA